MFNFSELLLLFNGLLLMVVVFSFINEKTIKFPYEIGLVVFGFTFIVLLIIGQTMDIIHIPEEILKLYKAFNFNDFLFRGVLCFMLFSGASRIKFNDFNPDKYLIISMAIIGTVISTAVYGLLFWGFGFIIQMNITLLEALILGAIVAPIDPISAMSILGKVGISKRIELIIEGEALFNDGVAVAIFAALISIQLHTSENISFPGFVLGFMSEILGASLVGIVVAFLFFKIFKHSENRYIKIFSSVLTVMSAYLICEYIGFSGPIAAVICGLYYATGIARLHRKHSAEMTQGVFDLFYSFWSVVENFLNGLLFLLVGLLCIEIGNIDSLSIGMILMIGSGAILIGTLSRSAGLFVAFAFNRNPPIGMKRVKFITFLTWAGLRGGLCLALVMGTSLYMTPSVYNLFLVATYFIVIFTTVVQGLTVGKAYTRLNK